MIGPKLISLLCVLAIVGTIAFVVQVQRSTAAVYAEADLRDAALGHSMRVNDAIQDAERTMAGQNTNDFAAPGHSENR